jgi:hypothetical protein
MRSITFEVRCSLLLIRDHWSLEERRRVVDLYYQEPVLAIWQALLPVPSFRSKKLLPVPDFRFK